MIEEQHEEGDFLLQKVLFSRSVDDGELFVSWHEKHTVDEESDKNPEPVDGPHKVSHKSLNDKGSFMLMPEQLDKDGLINSKLLGGLATDYVKHAVEMDKRAVPSFQARAQPRHPKLPRPAPLGPPRAACAELRRRAARGRTARL